MLTLRQTNILTLLQKDKYVDTTTEGKYVDTTTERQIC